VGKKVKIQLVYNLMESKSTIITRFFAYPAIQNFELAGLWLPKPRIDRLSKDPSHIKFRLTGGIKALTEHLFSTVFPLFLPPLRQTIY
jgi:hypothetical protein